MADAVMAQAPQQQLDSNDAQAANSSAAPFQANASEAASSHLSSSAQAALETPAHYTSSQTRTVLDVLQEIRGSVPSDRITRILLPLSNVLLGFSLRLDVLEYNASSTPSSEGLRRDIRQFANSLLGQNDDIDAALDIIASRLPSQSTAPEPKAIPVTQPSQPSTLAAVASTSAAPTATKTTPGPASTSKARAQNRKVELSRAVRTTMCEMMNLKTFSDPLPDWPGTSPQTITLPDGTTKQQWFWHWKKTMNGSQDNKRFSDAIQKEVQRVRDEGVRWKDVPEEDWPALEKAVESAYVNLRRERDARQDDGKKAKKDETRRKNRRRGMKEEKTKRRKSAWEVLKNRDGLEEELTEMGFKESERQWVDGEGVQIKYMSSEESSKEEEEEEKDDDALLASSKKAPQAGHRSKLFLVRPLQWRSASLKSLYNRLDTIKPPERAYRRRVGEPKEDAEPPKETPEWLIDTEWRNKHPLEEESDEGPKKPAKKRKIAESP